MGREQRDDDAYVCDESFAGVGVGYGGEPITVLAGTVICGGPGSIAAKYPVFFREAIEVADSAPPTRFTALR